LCNDDDDNDNNNNNYYYSLEKMTIAMHCNLRSPDVAPLVLDIIVTIFSTIGHSTTAL